MLSARDFGLEVVNTSSGEELVRCPFHEDVKPSAWFNPQKGLFWCSVCQLGLNSVQLGNRLGVDLDGLDAPLAGEHIQDYSMISDPVVFDPGLRFYHPYMEERGVDRETASLYDIRWKFDEPQAAVLPISNIYMAVVGAVYRYLDPAQAGTRYRKHGVQYPVWPMQFLPFVSDGALIIVTEGAWSAMKMTSVMRRAGFEGAVFSTMGARANQAIIDVLRPFEPVFLYDDDEAGRRAARTMRSLAPTWHSWTLTKAPDDQDDTSILALMESITRKVSA